MEEDYIIRRDKVYRNHKKVGYQNKEIRSDTWKKHGSYNKNSVGLICTEPSLWNHENMKKLKRKLNNL